MEAPLIKTDIGGLDVHGAKGVGNPNLKNNPVQAVPKANGTVLASRSWESKQN